MVEATGIIEKQKLSPLAQVKDIAVSLGLDGASWRNLSHKIDLWMREFKTEDPLLASVEKLHQRLFSGDDSYLARKFREVYGGPRSVEFVLDLIDPDRTLDENSVQRIKTIWR